MSLVISRRGNELLSFERTESPVPPPDAREISLPFALAVVVHQGKVLFMFNTWRNEWELPGGMINDGETPEEAAKRELLEETSQVASQTHFVGLAKMRLKPDDRLEFGAIYACQLEQIAPFQPNHEATSIIWWDLKSPLEGDVSEIDTKLAELTLKTRQI